MIAYVLIIMLSGNGSGIHAVTTQEFTSKATCEAAITAIPPNWKNPSLFMARCVEK